MPCYGDNAALRRAAVAAFTSLDRAAATAAWLQPLVEEDCNPMQLEVLDGLLEESQRQQEWQPFIASGCTFMLDHRGRQEIHPAIRFARGMRQS